MRGKGTTWATACALLAAAILPALAAGGLAEGCVTVSATVTEDHGTQREVCPPDGPGGPGDPGDGPDVGDPPGGVGDNLDPVGEVQETLDDVEHGATVCREVLRTENRDREPTRVSVCAHAEADVPTRWGDWGYSLSDCEVQNREATDPSVHVGDGGAAACLFIEAEPGGLVDVDTDDCPEDDPTDPTVRIAWITIQVCPEQEVEQLREDLEDSNPDPDGPSGPGDGPAGDGDGDDEGDDQDEDDESPASNLPPLPSNDEGVYSRIRDAIGSYGDDGSSGDGNSSGDDNSSHNSSSDHNGSSTGNSSSSHNGSTEGNSSAEDDGEGDDGAEDDEGLASNLPPLPSNDEGVYSRIREARDSAEDTAPSPNETLPADVDDERCPDDMLQDSTVHAAGWTFWVCVHDPTS